MNIEQLAADFAERFDLSQSQAERMVRRVFETIARSIKRGEEVAIPDFGTFCVKHRKARVVRNPVTRELMKLPMTRAMGLRTAKAMRRLK